MPAVCGQKGTRAMFGWSITKIGSEPGSFLDMEYLDCIRDLVNHQTIKSMKNYIQHKDINCLEHCLYVSYTVYLICKKLGWDYQSAARGGLLHDFFLYDWHTTKPHKGLHGFVHPRIALQNANQYFFLNDLEQDSICRHMWPLTIIPPKYKESYIICAADKYCAFKEIFNSGEKKDLRRLQNLLWCSCVFKKD